MTTGERFFLFAMLAVLLAPFWGYAVAAMYDNATTDSDYPYTGFCPDCLECEDPAELPNL